MQPTIEVRVELEQFLERDTSRLGDVYRGNLMGKSPEQIAEALQVSTSNFVWNYTELVKALLDGKVLESPTMALAAARKFRSLLRGEELSETARDYLREQLIALERRGEDTEAAAVESLTDIRKVSEFEKTVNSGIYVYALPNYLRHPVDPATGRTLMKVGMSERDIIQRFRDQTRTTALPEEPVLLRVYPADSSNCSLIEKQFHLMLEAADHSRNVARSAGREWFLTSTRFLDQFAKVLQLEVVVLKETADFSE